MILSYKNTAQIEQKNIIKTAESLSEYTIHLKRVANEGNYEYLESSVNLPFDEEVIGHLNTLKRKLVTKKLKYVLDIGIGGSNLGTKAVYDAMFGYFDVIEPNRYPKMIFADTNDSDYIYRLKKFLDSIKDPNEILINAVSKSGSTTETIANLEILLNQAINYKNRLVITTDYGSDLWEQAKSQKVHTLPIPEKVGGRYSVFSSVGLFPLLCSNIDIYSLLEGAMEMRNKCIVNSSIRNPAILSAVILYLNYKNSKRINVNFMFHPELESLGKWYRQLMGESIGKKGVGITPTVAVGSTDLHSMGQLYLGGPRDKFFTFVSSMGHDHDYVVPNKPPFPLVVEEIRGKSSQDIMDAILGGVKKAYGNADLPYMEIKLNQIAEKSIGKYMQLKMIEMMYLGKLLKVNSFDQPNVEEYKLETKKILNG